MSELLTAKRDPLETVHNRLLHYAINAPKDMSKYGLSGAGASGYGRKLNYSGRIGGLWSEVQLHIDVPLPQRRLFRETIRTAIFHTVTPSPQSSNLFNGDPRLTEDYAVESLVLDSENTTSLVSHHRIHVERPERSIDNYLDAIGGEWPYLEGVPNLTDLDWREAKETHLHAVDDIIAARVQLQIDAGYTNTLRYRSQ